MLLYSTYVKARKPKLYKVLLEKSKQYRECVQRGFAYYNVSSILARNLDKLIREDERLTIERELALS
jgi:SOS response regulatory protein OraA/RecX